MPETKHIRIYIEDEAKLIELRRARTRKKGEQASYADVVHWLLTCRDKSEQLLEKMGYLERVDQLERMQV